MLRRSHRCLPYAANPVGRIGFTLIELIVCIFVIGILLALLVPAVQQVREAARATECRSKLHQINLAIHQYLESHLCFPCPSYGDDYSYSLKILPQLDLAAIARDFQAGNGLQHFMRPLPQLRCPSEVSHSGNPFVSYFMNYGSRLPDESGLGRNGFFGEQGPLSDRDVIDGMSHTVIISEVIISDPGNPDDPRGKNWILSGQDYLQGDESEFADHCQAMPMSSADAFDLHSNGWVFHVENHYYHLLPPNHRSCKIQGGPEVRNSSSWHRGIAHTAYADGSVRVTSNSVDRGVWWALGSRNGGEVVSSGDSVP